jgi:hypothetical protein
VFEIGELECRPQVCFRPYKGGLASTLQQVFSLTEMEDTMGRMK